MTPPEPPPPPFTIKSKSGSRSRRAEAILAGRTDSAVYYGLNRDYPDDDWTPSQWTDQSRDVANMLAMCAAVMAEARAWPGTPPEFIPQAAPSGYTAQVGDFVCYPRLPGVWKISKVGQHHITVADAPRDERFRKVCSFHGNLIAAGSSSGHRYQGRLYPAHLNPNLTTTTEDEATTP